MIPSEKYNHDLCIKNDILSTIAYFDIFSYPLKKREIWLFLPNIYSHNEFEIALQLLVENSAIYKLGEFYSLQNNYTITQRRIVGNEKAKEMIIVAKKVAAFLSKFPYVRGVGVSGSLSKNYADNNSDIDLFIITAKNRLWIARTFMHCFKKLAFLFNKQHFFCMNYFIDEQKLEIAEKNIYTATEIVTLLPLQGSTAFAEFYSSNAWTKNFLPNNYMRVSTAKEIKSSVFKWMAEKLFNNSLGNMLDDLLMKITAKRWQQKTNKRKLNNRGIIMGMCSSKYCAKPDPKNFQNKFIELYERKVFELAHKNIVVMKPAQ